MFAAAHGTEDVIKIKSEKIKTKSFGKIASDFWILIKMPTAGFISFLFYLFVLSLIP